MPKKIKSVKIETVGKLSSTVKVTTARFNSPVEDTSPLGYVTIADAIVRHKFIEDLLVASDVPSIFSSKTLLENVNVLEESTIALNKVFFDQISSLNPAPVFSLIKILSDTQSLSDNDTFSFIKPLTDSFLVDDTGYIFISDYIDPTYFAENYVGAERYFT